MPFLTAHALLPSGVEALIVKERCNHFFALRLLNSLSIENGSILPRYWIDVGSMSTRRIVEAVGPRNQKSGAKVQKKTDTCNSRCQICATQLRKSYLMPLSEVFTLAIEVQAKQPKEGKPQKAEDVVKAQIHTSLSISAIACLRVSISRYVPYFRYPPPITRCKSASYSRFVRDSHVCVRVQIRAAPDKSDSNNRVSGHVA